MSVRREENDTWTAQVWYRDARGHRRHTIKRGFETEDEAKKWEDSFSKADSESMSMKFSQFVELYTEDLEPRLRETTWKTKKNMIEKKIVPFFGDMSMDEISTIDVIRWQNEMMTAKGPTGKGYAQTYLRAVNNQLTAIFNHAVRYYGLPKSPCARVEKMGAKSNDDMKFWTKEEYLKFSEAVMDKPDSFTAFEILYWCGLRVGEMLALTPSDIDLGRSTISVTKSYQRIHGRDIITEPKTKKSIRTVVMPKFLAEEIAEYMASLDIGEDDRMFPVTKGRMHHEMDRGCKESGVKRIRIHDLRHSHVSLLIDMGFSAVAIADRVGHESANITYRYAHMFPNTQKEMANALDVRRGKI